MRELVVISGKGGTGKTSITAAFAFMAKNAVIADCDVDASNMHILLSPEVINTTEFYSGNYAVIDEEKCLGCRLCQNLCRFNAITRNEKTKKFKVSQQSCEGCGLCVYVCPAKIISFPEANTGKWMESETKYGHMIHAHLYPGSENSGKLVTAVRNRAKQKAIETGAELIIVDGPPGIGCPVISAISGASDVLIVTEPTVSGEHDLIRTLQLTSHFSIPASVCINKYDINPEITEKIEQLAQTHGATVVGKIKYDKSFTDAQIAGKTVAETNSETANEIYLMWQCLTNSNKMAVK